MSTAPVDGQERSELHLYYERIAQFLQLLDEDPTAALASAQRAVSESAKLPRDHSERGDALELVALAQNRFENFRQALDCATELVRIRRRAEPISYELLAHALSLQALALFALERSEEADAALEEQLASWRKALPPGDIRLALKLENYAQYVAKGFGRTETLRALLREAIAIREAFPEPARGGLAATLQELALQEIRDCAYADAEQNLARAAELLAAEIERDPKREENKAGLAQIFALRCAVAFVRDDFEAAEAHAIAAHRIRLHDRVLSAENTLLLAMTRSAIARLGGDLRQAIEQHEKMLAVFAKHEDLVASGALDAAQRGDILLALGTLHLERHRPADAEKYLSGAIEVLGESSEVLFALTDYYRQTGNHLEATRSYQSALRLRKESGTEMLVLFGTNRAVKQQADPLVFKARAAGELSLGFGIVRVPGAQFSTSVWLEQPKSQSAGSLLLGRATNPEPLVFRPDTPRLGAQEFRKRADGSVAAARLYPNSALVFVHGYNVPFEAAIKRGAQLVRDLNYDSAAFVFAWPSLGRVSAYHVDRWAAHGSAAAFADFLEEVQRASGAAKIHIIAHSMGNRVALGGLVAATSRKESALRATIGEVVLAAPAVPVGEFTTWLDELQKQGVERVTLYASARDRALKAGFLAELTRLAGFVANGEPVQHPILQSLDITASGGINLLDHDVFASNPVMMEDIRQLLQTGVRPPHERAAHFVAQPSKERARYWRYVVASSLG